MGGKKNNHNTAQVRTDYKHNGQFGVALKKVNYIVVPIHSRFLFGSILLNSFNSKVHGQVHQVLLVLSYMNPMIPSHQVG